MVHRAAGLATGCQVSIEYSWGSVFDIRQNKALGTLATQTILDRKRKKIEHTYILSGGEVANIVLNKYGAIDYEWGIKSASTDFVRHYLSNILSIVLTLFFYYYYYFKTVRETLLTVCGLLTYGWCLYLYIYICFSSSFSSSWIWCAIFSIIVSKKLINKSKT